MMREFFFSAHPTRVVFGPGSLERLPEEVHALGAKRAIVLCTPGQRAQAESAAAALGGCCAGLFDGAQMHVPLPVAQLARQRAVELQADCAVALGGGSAIGLGKAIALEFAMPIIAVPTTYAGSEMTPIYGITDAGEKRTGRDTRVLPRTVLYDPLLSQSLPFELSVTSGLNAMAHAAEGLYAADGNPVTMLMAEEGLRAMAQGLRLLASGANEVDARSDCLYAAWLCGAVLGQVGMALHHKLCHTLGGSFNLPHADTHAVVLPHALAYNAGETPQAMVRIARAIGAADGPAGLYDLAVELGAPTSLSSLGMAESDLDRAAKLAAERPYPNPRELDVAALRLLLQDAWAGRRPVERASTVFSNARLGGDKIL